MKMQNTTNEIFLPKKKKKKKKKKEPESDKVFETNYWFTGEEYIRQYCRDAVSESQM